MRHIFSAVALLRVLRKFATVFKHSIRGLLNLWALLRCLLRRGHRQKRDSGSGGEPRSPQGTAQSYHVDLPLPDTNSIQVPPPIICASNAPPSSSESLDLEAYPTNRPLPSLPQSSQASHAKQPSDGHQEQKLPDHDSSLSISSSSLHCSIELKTLEGRHL